MRHITYLYFSYLLRYLIKVQVTFLLSGADVMQQISRENAVVKNKHTPSKIFLTHCARAAATAQSSPHSKQKTFEFFCSFVLKIMTSVKKKTVVLNSIDIFYLLRLGTQIAEKFIQINKLSCPDKICSTFESHEGGIIKGTFEFEARKWQANSSIYIFER